jgi:tetratricopeptide (TPR) repeat protein
VDSAVEEIRSRLAAGASSIAVVGFPSSGRSTVLRRLADELKGDRVVQVSMPHGDDAAAVGLTQVAAQLAEVGGLLDTVKDIGRPWAEKQSQVLRALTDVNAVVLFDEPRLDLQGDLPQDLFQRRAYEFSKDLLGAKLRRVVAVDRTIFGAETITLEAGSDPRAVLDPSRWNGLGPAAAELLKAGRNLERWSPLELRLAVALIGRGESAKTIASGLRGRLLGRRLLELVTTAKPLYALLQKLSLVRLPFEQRLLESFLPNDLSAADRKLLLEVLLFEVDGRWVLHAILARELQLALVGDRRASAVTHAHHQLGDYYATEFKSQAAALNAGAALRMEMEAVHHFTQACDDGAAAGVAMHFGEQLDALGKALSLAGRRLDAVSCYERALQHNDSDTYAHHYKAYNLDYEAVRVVEVESHYRRAIELDAAQGVRHVWHHGRFICFLITRGREREARAAWLHAVDALSSPTGGYVVRDVYEELHRQVALLALHRGHLDFASDVLADVENDREGRVARGADWFKSLERQLTQLREAEINQVVFPPDLDEDERWNGPHWGPQSADVEWMPGRIDRYSDEQAHLRIAKKEGDQILFGWLDVPIDELRAAYPRPLPAGTFVEVVRLNGEQKIFAHPRANDRARAQAILPPPDRYLRRAAAARP